MRKQLLPLGIKNPTKTELPALIALEAIGQPWFGDSHRSDLLAMALVSQILAEETSYIHTIAGELIDFLAAGELDIDELRPIVMDINTWIQAQSNSRIDAAIEQLVRQERKSPKK